MSRERPKLDLAALQQELDGFEKQLELEGSMQAARETLESMTELVNGQINQTWETINRAKALCEQAQKQDKLAPVVERKLEELKAKGEELKREKDRLIIKLKLLNEEMAAMNRRSKSLAAELLVGGETPATPEDEKPIKGIGKGEGMTLSQLRILMSADEQEQDKLMALYLNEDDRKKIEDYRAQGVADPMDKLINAKLSLLKNGPERNRSLADLYVEKHRTFKKGEETSLPKQKEAAKKSIDLFKETEAWLGKLGYKVVHIDPDGIQANLERKGAFITLQIKKDPRAADLQGSITNVVAIRKHKGDSEPKGNLYGSIEKKLDQLQQPNVLDSAIEAAEKELLRSEKREISRVVSEAEKLLTKQGWRLEERSDDNRVIRMKQAARGWGTRLLYIWPNESGDEYTIQYENDTGGPADSPIGRIKHGPYTGAELLSTLQGTAFDKIREESTKKVYAERQELESEATEQLTEAEKKLQQMGFTTSEKVTEFNNRHLEAKRVQGDKTMAICLRPSANGYEAIVGVFKYNYLRENAPFLTSRYFDRLIRDLEPNIVEAAAKKAEKEYKEKFVNDVEEALKKTRFTSLEKDPEKMEVVAKNEDPSNPRRNYTVRIRPTGQGGFEIIANAGLKVVGRSKTEYAIPDKDDLLKQIAAGAINSQITYAVEDIDEQSFYESNEERKEAQTYYADAEAELKSLGFVSIKIDPDSRTLTATRDQEGKIITLIIAPKRYSPDSGYRSSINVHGQGEEMNPDESRMLADENTLAAVIGESLDPENMKLTIQQEIGDYEERTRRKAAGNPF